MKKNLPIIYFSSAFFFSFILFFVRPLFFNENLVMKEMLLVPYLKPIGIDLTQYLDFIHSWLNGTQVQFSDSNIYPPLCNIVLLPLLFFESYSVQFFVLSLISFLSFLFITIIFPFFSSSKSNREEGTSLIVLSFVISIMSYPFLFQIERGQFDLIAMAFSLLGVLLFHRSSKSYFWAYAALAIGIQIKLFPAILIFAFIKATDSNWDIFKRLILNGLINLLLLFSLGIDKAMHFIKAIVHRASDNIYYYREINNSIQSFFHISIEAITGKTLLISIILFSKWVLLIILLVIFVYMIAKCKKQMITGVSPALLLNLMILSLILPGTSHDYKIAYFSGALIYFLMSLKLGKKREHYYFMIVSFCYTIMLWHFWDHKTFDSFILNALLKMNFPALVLIYFISFLVFVDNKKTT